MKKNILYAMLFAMATLTLTSCNDKDSEGLSRILYYPVLTMNGDAFMKVEVGGNFNDPGCTATVGTEDISSSIVTTSDVNTSKPGFYTVSYAAKNDEGYTATAKRTVMVKDSKNFASTYLAECFYSEARHYYNTPIYITSLGGDLYEIDDIIGGYQFNGVNPGFEPRYDFHLEAKIKLHADNTITVEEMGKFYFTTVVTLQDGKYDPETGTIVLKLLYGTANMTVTLTK